VAAQGSSLRSARRLPRNNAAHTATRLINISTPTREMVFPAVCPQFMPTLKPSTASSAPKVESCRKAGDRCWVVSMLVLPPHLLRLRDNYGI
jgi:hypothetical protein